VSFKTLIIAAIGLRLMLLTGCTDQNNAEVRANTQNQKETEMTTADHRKIDFETITGEKTSLADYSGKVVLIVNTASKCGFTKQYVGLEDLYRERKDDGLVVIGFPANNFADQEPGTNEEILKFCRGTFDVTFPMMAKVSVKGDDQHPLFRYFTEESDLPGEIKWNFNKFLLDRDGNLVARYESAVEPDDKELVARIEELL